VTHVVRRLERPVDVLQPEDEGKTEAAAEEQSEPIEGNAGIHLSPHRRPRTSNVIESAFATVRLR
jgi:hypothetical protein